MSIINSILSMTVVGFKDQKSKWYSPLFTCHARWFHQCMLLWNNVQLFLIDRTGWIWFCEPGIPPTVIILTHSKVVHSYNTGPSQGLKIQGGARSNVVGIMCPPGWDRVNWSTKILGCHSVPGTPRDETPVYATPYQNLLKMCSHDQGEIWHSNSIQAPYSYTSD